MENPFLEDGYLNLNASINKVIIAKMPTSKVREDYTGKSAMDIFCTALFIDEIKRNCNKLKLDLSKIEEKKLPQYLNQCLISDDECVQKCAEDIAHMFGERLGVILLVLKKGEKENREKRTDWNDDNWDYWKQLSNVILVGGLSSGNIGIKLKECIEKVFRDADEKCYNIILNKDSANIGIKGCSSLIRNISKECKYIVLDCGQTFIKRSLVNFKDDEKIEINELEKVPSQNVLWEFDNSEEERKEAEKLHKHIVNIVEDTIKYSEKKNIKLGTEIVISIANYVKNGLLADRGGYGKLRLLSSNYEEYLSSALDEESNVKFKIKLIHDGSAMAAAFKKYKNAVCISLGTAFGVGYPTGY